MRKWTRFTEFDETTTIRSTRKKMLPSIFPVLIPRDSHELFKAILKMWISYRDYIKKLFIFYNTRCLLRQRMHPSMLRKIKRLGCYSHTLQLVLCHFDKFRNEKGQPLAFSKIVKKAEILVRKFNKSIMVTPLLINNFGMKLLGDSI